MPAIPHDKFYTPDATARRCIGDLWRACGMRGDDLFIEPSAGAGAFCRHLPEDRLIALDIKPEAGGIETGDFLTYEAPDYAGRRIVIGNPPFGRNGTLARAFMRQAMQFADIVAFILPASYAKRSMQRGIDRHYHLVHQANLPAQVFETSDGDQRVNTVFQIWERRGVLRDVDEDPVSQSHFAFVKDIRDADLVIRRVGARAGAVLPAPAMTADGLLPEGYAPSSNYYIRAIDCDPDKLSERLASLDLASLSRDAVCPSLSKRDVVSAYVEAVDRAAEANVADHLVDTTNARTEASIVVVRVLMGARRWAVTDIRGSGSVKTLSKQEDQTLSTPNRLEPPEMFMFEARHRDLTRHAGSRCRLFNR